MSRQIQLLFQFFFLRRSFLSLFSQDCLDSRGYRSEIVSCEYPDGGSVDVVTFAKFFMSRPENAIENFRSRVFVCIRLVEMLVIILQPHTMIFVKINSLKGNCSLRHTRHNLLANYLSLSTFYYMCQRERVIFAIIFKKIYYIIFRFGYLLIAHIQIHIMI